MTVSEYLAILDAYDYALWGLWAVVVILTIIVMARDSARGALHGRRALEVVALGTLAMFAIGITVVFVSGYWHVGHSGDSLGGFVFWVFIRLVVAFPTWIVIAITGLLVWGSRAGERST